MFQFTQANIEFAMLVIGFVGAVAFGIGKLVSGFSTGKADKETDADRALRIARESNAVFERRIHELEGENIEKTKAIASLQGELKSLNEINRQYLAILQNRSPDIENLARSMTAWMESVTKQNETISSGIAALLKGQDEIMKKPSIAITNQSPAATAA